jgi:hypothetical protein
MKKLLAALALISLSGCAVLTASPSLPAYIAAHAAGITAAGTVAGATVTAETLFINTKIVAADIASPTPAK